MTRAPVRTPTSLGAFAAAVSSATDLELAAWQEHGITQPSSRDGTVLWSIITVSLLALAGAGATAFASFQGLSRLVFWLRR